MVSPPALSRTTAGAVGSASPDGDSATDTMCLPPRAILGHAAHYYGLCNPNLSMWLNPWACGEKTGPRIRGAWVRVQTNAHIRQPHSAMRAAVPGRSWHT